MTITHRSANCKKHRRIYTRIFRFGLVVMVMLSIYYSIVAGNATRSLEIRQQKPSNLVWFWRRYSETTDDGLQLQQPRRKKILIAQISDLGRYSEMLDVTQRANRVYARKFGFDYVAMRGLAMGGWIQVGSCNCKCSKGV